MHTIDPAVVKSAMKAKERALAPFSKFRVGAVAVTRDGCQISGCNIEISSYGLTICAERVALFKAVSEGIRQFEAIYISADTDDPCPPCGACRQVIWELAGDVLVVMIDKSGRYNSAMMHDLLPAAFDQHFFE